MGIIAAAMGGMMGMPAFFVVGAMAMGMPPAIASIGGWVLHFVVSVSVGVAFGAVSVNVGVLRPTSASKTVAVGAGAGIVAYVVLFVPITMTMLPPFLMQVMRMTPAQVGSLAPILLGAGFVVHVIFGVLLGGVFWFGKRK